MLNMNIAALPRHNIGGMAAAVAMAMAASTAPALAAPGGQFAEACKGAGVHIVASPVRPARSIALDWSPRVRRQLKTYYELSSTGRIKAIGAIFWTARRANQTAFWEERLSETGAKPRAPYLRHQQSAGPVPIDALTADILVVDNVSDPAEFDQPVKLQGVIRHALTATDRRDGRLLGTMVYVIDMAGRRACGANAKNAIDVEAFMLQAAAIPVVIPASEVERRQRSRQRAAAVFHFPWQDDQ
jgi:hypothetical protein